MCNDTSFDNQTLGSDQSGNRAENAGRQRPTYLPLYIRTRLLLRRHHNVKGFYLESALGLGKRRVFDGREKSRILKNHVRARTHSSTQATDQ